MMPRGLFVFALILALAGHPAPAQTVPLGRPIATVGDRDGSVERIFGRIADIEVDGRGRIYVLDNYSQNLRVYRADMTLLTTFGRAGRGPDEFGDDVLASDLTADGDLVVLDSRNARLSRLRFRDATLELSGSQRLPLRATDLCHLGGTSALWSSTAQQLVALLRPDGSVASTLAGRERPTGDLVKVMGTEDHFLNHGRLACDPAGQTVFLAHTFHSAVRAYGLDGHERWRAELPDFRRQLFTRGRDGRCCGYLIPDPRYGIFHVSEAVTVSDQGEVVVTLRETDGSGSSDRFEVRVLSAASGSEVARYSVPGPILTVRAGRAYVAVEDPWPRLEVYRWPAPP